MTRIMAQQDFDRIKERLDIVHCVHYFDEVVSLYENRTISKFTLTPADAERLRVLLKKIKSSL